MNLYNSAENILKPSLFGRLKLRRARLEKNETKYKKKMKPVSRCHLCSSDVLTPTTRMPSGANHKILCHDLHNREVI